MGILIKSVTHTEFSGDLKPFNELKSRLNRKLHKKNKFPPFEFDDEIEDNEINIKKEIPMVRKNCRYCGSKLEISDEFCSNCGTKID
ncbi:MAG: zinc ribbon domain-containing protein [Candidatus Thorarchaeota archaeon]